jgi:ATP-dependent Clp protease, protease subunit
MDKEARHIALLVKRQIMLLGSITPDVQERICSSIILLNAQSDDPITIFIDSMGGNAPAGDQTADIVADSKARVTGVVFGAAHSAAFSVLQGCHVRKAYPHTFFLFHAPTPRSCRGDDEEGVERALDECRRGHTEEIARLILRCGHTEEEWREWSRKERRFTASEALELNIIDEIIRPPVITADSKK